MKTTRNVLFGGMLIALGAIQPALAGSIGGLVEDCNGNPIAGAFVLITQPDGTFVRKGVTAGNGSFQFDFIDAGTYDVKVVCPNGKLLERRVTKGKGDQTRVRFVCPCTARASGTVSGVEGAWVVEKSPFDSATLIFDSGRLEIRASSRGNVVRGQGTYRQLEQVLSAAESNGVDLAILDTAPHSESASLAAARAADLVLLPCRPAISTCGLSISRSTWYAWRGGRRQSC